MIETHCPLQANKIKQQLRPHFVLTLFLRSANALKKQNLSNKTFSLTQNAAGLEERGVLGCGCLEPFVLPPNIVTVARGNSLSLIYVLAFVEIPCFAKL